ncbi:MAG TPA: O-antigen ligase family protein [Ktedonobacterales bacterium]
MPATFPRPANLPPVADMNAASTRRGAAKKRTIAYIVVFLITLVLTPILILAGASQGYVQILATIAALVALALVPWRPILGLYLMVISAVVIEQEPLLAGAIGTDHLYVFYWPAKLQGNIERPIGYFFLVVLLTIVITGLLLKRRTLFGGRLFYPFLALLGALVVGVLHGLASGGEFRIIVLEVRPWWYFFLAYVLAYNIVSDVKHVRNIIWITILGTAIKGVQGVYIVYAYLGGQVGGHNEIMAHEQSFFFVLVLLLLAMLFLYRFQPGIFIAILFSLPCLLIALVANNRRADYVALFIGIAVVWAMAILVKPESRRALISAAVICLILGAGYVVAFQKSSGALGEPARAVVSVFNPSAADARDAASNLYRIVENYDLKYTEAQSPLLGYGFGKPFLQPILLANVLDLDPYYLYIPHNNVLWIWMRLGPLGFGALWYLIGTSIVSGCIMARRLKNKQLQFFAIFAVATVVMEVILAYGDYQFFFYRNMIFVGIVLGVLMKLPAIERASLGQPGTTNDDLFSESTPKQSSRPRPRARLASPLSLPAAMARVAQSPGPGK